MLIQLHKRTNKIDPNHAHLVKVCRLEEAGKKIATVIFIFLQVFIFHLERANSECGGLRAGAGGVPWASLAPPRGWKPPCKIQ